jgi:hypothetical protein
MAEGTTPEYKEGQSVSIFEFNAQDYQIVNDTNINFFMDKYAKHYWGKDSKNDTYEINIYNFTVKEINKVYTLRVTFNADRYMSSGEALKIIYEIKNGILNKSGVTIAPNLNYNNSCLTSATVKIGTKKVSTCKTASTSKLNFSNVKIYMGNFTGYSSEQRTWMNSSYDYINLNIVSPQYKWTEINNFSIGYASTFTAIDDVNVTACGTLNINNTIYQQTANITSATACITMSGNNITFNMNNYTLNISAGSQYTITTIGTGGNYKINDNKGTGYFSSTAAGAWGILAQGTNITINNIVIRGVYAIGIINTGAVNNYINNVTSLYGLQTSGAPYIINVNRAINTTIVNSNMICNGTTNARCINGINAANYTTIINNTFWASARATYAVLTIGIGNVISNNIFKCGYTSTGLGSVARCGSFTNAIIENNIFYYNPAYQAYLYSTTSGSYTMYNNSFYAMTLANGTGGAAISASTEGSFISTLNYSNEFGYVEWAQTRTDINVLKSNFSLGISYVFNISNNRIFINASEFNYTGSNPTTINNLSLNTTFKFFNLPTNYTCPVVYRNSTACNSTTSPSCFNTTSLNAGNVTFISQGMAEYILNETCTSSPPVTSCTYSGIGNWLLNCADNCAIYTTTTNINGNLTINGTATQNITLSTGVFNLTNKNYKVILPINNNAICKIIGFNKIKRSGY